MSSSLEKVILIKNQLEAFRPLPVEVLRNLEEWFEVELTYSSNAIEGSTLTRQETAIVLEKGITIGEKSIKEHLEAINQRNALTFMKKLVSRVNISFDDITSLHQLILK